MANSEIRLNEPDLNNWELRQLVKSGLYPDENAALRSALRALFQASPETKLKMVISAYQAAEISLGKASSMLGVSQEEMKDILREAGVEIYLGPQNTEELIEDSHNA